MKTWIPRLPVTFGTPVDAQVLEGAAVEAGEDERLLPGRPRPGVDVDERPARLRRGVDRRGPGVELDGGLVAEPGQGRDAVGDDVGVRPPVGRVGLAPAGHPVGRPLRHVLLPEEVAVDAVGVAGEVEGPPGEVGEHHRRDQGQVADEVALRDGRLVGLGRQCRVARALRGRRAGPGREHLVEVRQGHVAAADRARSRRAGQRVERGQLVVRRRLDRRCAGATSPASTAADVRRRAPPPTALPPARATVRRPRPRRRRPSPARARPPRAPPPPGARPTPDRPRAPPGRTSPGGRSRRATSRRSRPGSRARASPTAAPGVAARSGGASSNGCSGRDRASSAARRRARVAASRPLPTRPAYRSRPSSITPDDAARRGRGGSPGRARSRRRPAPGSGRTLSFSQAAERRPGLVAAAAVLGHGALEALGGGGREERDPVAGHVPAVAHPGMLAQDQAEDLLALLERDVEVGAARAPRQVEGHEDERGALAGRLRLRGWRAGPTPRSRRRGAPGGGRSRAGPRRRGRRPRRRRSPRARRARPAGRGAPGSSGRRRARCASGARPSRRPRSPGRGSRPTSARRASRRRRTARVPGVASIGSTKAGRARGASPAGSRVGSGAGAGWSARGATPGRHLLVRAAGPAPRPGASSGSQPGIASGPALAMRSQARPRPPSPPRRRPRPPPRRPSPLVRRSGPA